MNIHEYQAKAVLRDFGVPLLRGHLATSVDEAVDAARELPGSKWVVKAQIHAGGRGKGGGVKVVGSLDEVKREAARMLGMTLVTPQTGPHGRVVRRLYIEEACDIAREFYLSALVDRETASVSLIASGAGGMDIEEVARKSPNAIKTFRIDPAAGFSAYTARGIANALEVPGDAGNRVRQAVEALYTAFIAKDMSLLEINPFVLTRDGSPICLDAKVVFDDNALFRHPDMQGLRDPAEEDPSEREAAKYDLSFIKLDGSIGCMVNGAGLAMATMDIIKLYGGLPANFLDVGGGASKEKVTAALKIILSDPAVKGILVNIFGGIMRCDIIANGIVEAAKEISLSVPLVVRLEGTNVEIGRAILAGSGLPIISASDLAEAAAKIVAEVKDR